MKLLLQENYITIYFDNENHCIVAEWKGYQTFDSIKSGCEKILEYIREYKVQKILYDNTNVEGIWSGAAAWLGSIWCPEIANAGILQLAWVYSTSAFSRFSDDEAMKHIHNKELIKTFENKSDAIQWLTNQGLK